MRGFGKQQTSPDLVGRALALQPSGDRLVERTGLDLEARARIAPTISCRCTKASHRVILLAVRDRWMTELEINDQVQGGWMAGLGIRPGC